MYLVENHHFGSEMERGVGTKQLVHVTVLKQVDDFLYKTTK